MKNLTIEVPKGHEIDLELSNLKEGKIVFKEVEQKLTYSSICSDMFKDHFYFLNGWGHIDMANIIFNGIDNPNNSTTREQLESILALNKLCNVAKYLNGDWLPNFQNTYETKFYLVLGDDNALTIHYTNLNTFGVVYFRYKKLAELAITILGEQEIIKALTLNH